MKYFISDFFFISTTLYVYNDLENTFFYEMSSTPHKIFYKALFNLIKTFSVKILLMTFYL